jgi:hypothetical protein
VGCALVVTDHRALFLHSLIEQRQRLFYSSEHAA